MTSTQLELRKKFVRWFKSFILNLDYSIGYSVEKLTDKTLVTRLQESKLQALKERLMYPNELPMVGFNWMKDILEREVERRKKCQSTTD